MNHLFEKEPICIEDENDKFYAATARRCALTFEQATAADEFKKGLKK